MADRLWTNPTGGNIRGQDDYGSGQYGADRDNGRRKHLGLDLESASPQVVVTPWRFRPERVAHIYTLTDRVTGAKRVDPARDNMGIVLSGPWRNRMFRVYLLYVDPCRWILDRKPLLEPGDPVGVSISLAKRYPARRSRGRSRRRRITDHVHVRVDELINGRWHRYRDPRPMLFGTGAS